MNMSMTMKAGNGVFLANTAGYFLSSMSSSFMLHHFGLQTSLLVACSCIESKFAPVAESFIPTLSSYREFQFPSQAILRVVGFGMIAL
jgi:hypothetical protein